VSSLDITPLVPQGRQFIQRYRGGVFRITEVDYKGPVLVTAERTQLWAAPAVADLTLEDFQPLLETPGTVELVLLGCGARMALPPPALRARLKAVGLVLEAMDTGAACRTYNVLMSEDRRVAAALLPLP
jgi:uncharacterized protein